MTDGYLPVLINHRISVRPLIYSGQSIRLYSDILHRQSMDIKVRQ